jgi:uncharacterized membrane protein
MTWYTFFKSIHVITAAIWVGGAAMIQAYALRILRTGDGRRQADFAKDTEVVGMRVKPTGDNGWFWGLLVAMVLGIAAVLAFHVQGEQQVPAPATE